MSEAQGGCNNWIRYGLSSKVPLLRFFCHVCRTVVYCSEEGLQTTE